VIAGTVNARLEAEVRLKVRGPSGAEAEVPVLIGTGFTGTLALPATVTTDLALAPLSGGSAQLADGTTRRFDTFEAAIEWNGVWRGVVASVLGDDALLGMALLSGLQLRVEVVPGGAVEVGALPWSDGE
jgi:clan AA aspartic protease